MEESKPKRERVKESEGDSMFMEETKAPFQANDPVFKRRIIRSHYREIGNRINEGKDEIANVDSLKFMAIMNEVENIHQHVHKPREQVADAEALLGLTRTLVASVKTHTNGEVTPAEFVSCLIREFGQQKTTTGLSENSSSISWKNISLVASPIFMNGRGFMTMVGPVKNEHKQRKLVVRAKRLKSIVKAQPKELERTAEVVTDTDRNMIVMFEILKKEKKVEVKNLILNRSSFAQTVENLFALSFLVKDGRVRVDVDDRGSHVIVPSNGPSAEEIMSGVASNHQFIFRFDFDDWKLMKTLVPEGKELMPKRDAFTYTCFAGFAKAKAKPGDKCFTQAEVIPIDSQLAHTAPIRKFTRNYGHTMQSPDLTEIGNGAIWNGLASEKEAFRKINLSF